MQGVTFKNANQNITILRGSIIIETYDSTKIVKFNEIKEIVTDSQYIFIYTHASQAQSNLPYHRAKLFFKKPDLNK